MGNSENAARKTNGKYYQRYEKEGYEPVHSNQCSGAVAAQSRSVKDKTATDLPYEIETSLEEIMETPEGQQYLEDYVASRENEKTKKKTKLDAKELEQTLTAITDLIVVFGKYVVPFMDNKAIPFMDNTVVPFMKNKIAPALAGQIKKASTGINKVRQNLGRALRLPQNSAKAQSRTTTNIDSEATTTPQAKIMEIDIEHEKGFSEEAATGMTVQILRTETVELGSTKPEQSGNRRGSPQSAMGA